MFLINHDAANQVLGHADKQGLLWDVRDAFHHRALKFFERMVHWQEIKCNVCIK